jgi:hypothetical protein
MAIFYRCVTPALQFVSTLRWTLGRADLGHALLSNDWRQTDTSQRLLISVYRNFFIRHGANARTCMRMRKNEDIFEVFLMKAVSRKTQSSTISRSIAARQSFQAYQLLSWSSFNSMLLQNCPQGLKFLGVERNRSWPPSAAFLRINRKLSRSHDTCMTGLLVKFSGFFLFFLAKDDVPSNACANQSLPDGDACC